MATNHIRMFLSGASSTPLGAELRQLGTVLEETFRKLEGHLDAAIQAKDNASDDETTHITATEAWGFDDNGGTAGTQALAWFNELSSLVGNHKAAVYQYCAKMKS